MKKGMQELLLAYVLSANVATAHGAEDLGLLLGLRAGHSYRTVWVVTNSRASAVQAYGPTIVVPRRSGFWQVDVDTLHGGRARQVEQNILLAWPAGHKRPRPVLDTAEVAYCDGPEPPRAAGTGIEVLFVGPEHVAVRREFHDECGAYPNFVERLAVLPLEQTADAVGIESLLGPRSRLALQRAATNWLEGIPPEDRDAYAPVETADWGIVRGPSAWQVLGHLGPSTNIAQNAESTFPSTISPPATITGFLEPATTLAPDPAVLTVLVAPSGDLTVSLMRSGRLLIRRSRARTTVVTHVALAGVDSVVLVQWATGRHVADWTRRLHEILRP